MKIIWKYLVVTTEEFMLPIPEGGKFLSLQSRKKIPICGF